jgi:hypothetical protein
MTIDDIKELFQFSFHDSDLTRLEIDYARSRAKFVFQIDLTSPDEIVEVPEREGTLEVRGLLYCAIFPPVYGQSPRTTEPPGPQDYDAPSPLWITSESSDFSQIEDERHSSLQKINYGFQHWFYTSSENTFIYIAGIDASWTWNDNLGSADSTDLGDR